MWRLPIVSSPLKPRTFVRSMHLPSGASENPSRPYGRTVAGRVLSQGRCRLNETTTTTRRTSLRGTFHLPPDARKIPNGTHKTVLHRYLGWKNSFCPARTNSIRCVLFQFQHACFFADSGCYHFCLGFGFNFLCFPLLVNGVVAAAVSSSSSYNAALNEGVGNALLPPLVPTGSSAPCEFWVN